MSKLRHCIRGRFTSRSRTRCGHVARLSSAIAAARRWCSKASARSDASFPRTSCRYRKASDRSFSETNVSDARVTRAMIQGLQTPQRRRSPFDFGVTATLLRVLILLLPSDTGASVTMHSTRTAYIRRIRRIASATISYRHRWICGRV